MSPSDLAVATAVRPLEHAPGWYVAHLPDDWSYVTPSGGVLMTVALRAMAASLPGSGLEPVSANALFCSPVPAGPLEVRVELLRQGNFTSQLRAALSSTRQPGPGLEVSATFARPKQGPDVFGVAPPAVPPPAECRDASQESRARAGAREWPFFRNVDIALAIGEPMWEPGWRAGEARLAYWYRYRVPQSSPGGRLDPLAIPPIADSMPGALHRRLGPEHEPFFAPSLDLTVHFLDPSDGDWLLVDVRCHRARAGYASADAEIWDEHGKLVASACQTMLVRRRYAHER